MGSSQYFAKDPDAVIDFQVDWTAWLGDDTIHSSSWDVQSGITKVSDTASSTAATIWLSGGTAGTTYRLTNRIVTHGGRTDDRSIWIDIRQR